MNEQNLEQIQKVKEDNLNSLTLYDDELDYLIPKIKELTHLKGLFFQGVQANDLDFVKEFKNLESIHFTWGGIKEVSSLKYCTKLKNIWIRESAYKPEGLNELTFLENLESLSIGYYEDKPLELYGFNNLKKFSITSKSQFKEIELSGFNELEDCNLRSPIVKLKLSGFGRLKELFFGRKLHRNLIYVSLQGFESLEILTLGFNELETCIINGCKNLRQLDLAGSRLSSYAFLENLIHLEDLDLSNTPVTDLSFLKNLISLKNLNLAINENVDRLEKIDELRNLENLEILNLHANQIKDLTVLSNLKNLKVLNADLNYIESVDSLTNLQDLETLNLQGNLVKDITPLAKLINLKSLNLTENPISGVEPLKNLHSLETLYLNDTQIKEVDVLANLKNLKKLDLTNNQITYISLAIIKELESLEELILTGNPIKNILKEIFDKQENCLTDVLNYLRTNADIYLNEAKMILIGNGEVGKSSIRIKLLDKNAPLPEKEDRTQGLEIKTYQTKGVEPKNTQHNDKIDFDLHIWDFGGQGRYREVQQLFCSRKSLYVFVTAYDDTPENENYVGFEYWLSMANAFGFDKDKQVYSPVIHVLNKIDKEIPPIDEEKRRGIFENIYPDFIKISCETLEKFDSLENAIKKVIPQISDDIFNTKFSKEWIAVKDILQEKQNEYHLDYKDYLQICSQNSINESESQTLIKILDRMGYVIYFGNHPQLKHWIILNPLWVKDAIYKVIDSNIIIDAKFYPQHFPLIWQSPFYNEKEHQKLIELMLAYQLCYQPENENFYIVPALLKDKPNIPPILQQYDYELCLTYYPFLPAGTLNKLIVNLHEYIYNNYKWKDGVILHFIVDDAYAEVTEVWQEKNVYIKLKGNDVFDLYHLILNTLQQLNQNIKETKNLSKLDFEVKIKYNEEYETMKTIQRFKKEKEFEFLFPDYKKSKEKPIIVEKDIKEQARELLEDGEIKQTIKLLLKYYRNKDLYPTLIAINVSFKNYNDDKIKGLNVKGQIEDISSRLSEVIAQM